ncbi:DUF1573 domain-containing protein [Limisphaera sp. VF-2]|jgi:hypothetical protein|uniref:DUF1573 domain-containing protein n=1 Tax=Limisphaera sp. VF-2 TaxID=3400418 RepID=UPI001762F3CC
MKAASRGQRPGTTLLPGLCFVWVWWAACASGQTPFDPGPLAPPTPNAPSLPPAPEAPAPRIHFAAPIHDFGRVVVGTVLRHDFYFTNTGTAPLEISNVHASCGCTTAGEWTRRVEPGQFGVLPVQLTTAGFQGMVIKTVTLSCNDPRQPNVTLQLRANLWTPIEMNPRYATLRANVERFHEARAVVQILSHEETPLRLQNPSCNNPLLKAEVIERVPGREFELVITPAGPTPTGNAQAVISIPTSSTNLPVLNLTALVLLDPVVTVAPPFIQLGPGPLPAAQTVEVSVMNNGTNRLRLSEVAVNHTNVTVDVQETRLGEYFRLQLHFPAGFQLAPGEVLALTARTSHPQHPLVRVPIAQVRTPAYAPQVPRPAPPVPASAAPQQAPPPVPPNPARPAAGPRPTRPPTEFPPLPGA